MNQKNKRAPPETEVRMIKAGIIGATGYAGGELVRILQNHKEAEIIWLGSKSYVGQRYDNIYRNLYHMEEKVCKADDLLDAEDGAVCLLRRLALAARLLEEHLLVPLDAGDVGVIVHDLAAGGMVLRQQCHVDVEHPVPLHGQHPDLTVL